MSSSSKKLATAARYVQGTAFLVFGLNGFLHFLPLPAPPPAAGAFFGALLATGYMFPLIKGTEVVTAVMLLSNRYVPLSLAVIAPVLVNILAFHVALEPSGLPVPLLLLATELLLAYSYRSAFAPMLQARVAPTAGSESAVLARASATA